MKKILFFLVISFLVLSSCTQHTDEVFKKKVVFKDQNWKRFDNQVFEFQVTPKDTLDLSMVFTYDIKKFNYKHFPINITLYTPGDEIRSRDYRYNFYDFKSKNWKGEIHGDTALINLNIRKGLSFSKAGKLKIVLENKNSRVDNPGIISLELKAVRFEKNTKHSK